MADDKPPANLLDVIGKSFSGLPPQLIDSMLSMLVAQALRKLPHEQKLKLIQQLAELVWPGSTRKSEEG